MTHKKQKGRAPRKPRRAGHQGRPSRAADAGSAPRGPDQGPDREPLGCGCHTVHSLVTERRDPGRVLAGLSGTCGLVAAAECIRKRRAGRVWCGARPTPRARYRLTGARLRTACRKRAGVRRLGCGSYASSRPERAVMRANAVPDSTSARFDGFLWPDPLTSTR